MDEINPLNTQSVKIDGKKNLMRNGKINALLDQMEIDADQNRVEAHHIWNKYVGSSYSPYVAKLYEDIQIQKDAYALARSIRKYAPFIEVGAMTIAEAISCETQSLAAKQAAKK